MGAGESVATAATAVELDDACGGAGRRDFLPRLELDDVRECMVRKLQSPTNAALRDCGKRANEGHTTAAKEGCTTADN